ncbi:hypothetical protein [Massilia sp. Leaf139]|uniref:hypothetical protein n=1 Tax=Massilia sp. Leaf139 TaxID=1736272 RepID=UPI0006F63498|nr:hypothetical protein [Massilia sp. Leaf139]KQQ93652.1 hypothetical protein ASF77_22475 [Massilia sp. Leaf139]
MTQRNESSGAAAAPAIRTWRERIGAGPDFPLHAPNDVERAMEAEIADLRAHAARHHLLPLNEDTQFILGRPNFACAGIANRLRQLGHDIQRRAESEQAAVIHFLLNLYQQHGAAWRERASDYLSRSADGKGNDVTTVTEERSKLLSEGDAVNVEPDQKSLLGEAA